MSDCHDRDCEQQRRRGIQPAEEPRYGKECQQDESEMHGVCLQQRPALQVIQAYARPCHAADHTREQRLHKQRSRQAAHACEQLRRNDVGMPRERRNQISDCHAQHKAKSSAFECLDQHKPYSFPASRLRISGMLRRDAQVSPPSANSSRSVPVIVKS